MPACAINDDHCMPVALGCQRYQFKVKHHGVFVDQGRNQYFRFTATWAHCPKQIPIIKLLLFDDTGTATPFCPKSCRLVLLAKFTMPLQSSGFRFIKQTIEPISQVICDPSINTGATHTE
ncbi:hypothetical protein AMR44_20835 [Shewanella algae]|nr:hypothetical protein AMR44_20835 [Shewanella algae]